MARMKRRKAEGHPHEQQEIGGAPPEQRLEVSLACLLDRLLAVSLVLSLTLNKNQLVGMGRSISAIDEAPVIDDLWSDALVGLVEELEQVAQVSVTGGHSIITLIANVSRSSSVVSIVCAAMARLGVRSRLQQQADAQAVR